MIFCALGAGVELFRSRMESRVPGDERCADTNGDDVDDYPVYEPAVVKDVAAVQEAGKGPVNAGVERVGDFLDWDVDEVEEFAMGAGEKLYESLVLVFDDWVVAWERRFGTDVQVVKGEVDGH